MTKKIVKLIDNRAVGNGMVRDLQGIIRGIKAGDITSMSYVYARRDGSLKTGYDCENALTTLGSVEFLKEYIMNTKLRQL